MTIGSNPPPARVAKMEPTPPGPAAKNAAVPGVENLRITATRGTPEEVRLPPGSYEAISKMIDQHFEALMTIAQNMGVSKEEREAAARRLKDLKEKRRKLEDLKKDELAEIIRLIGILKADAADEDWLRERRAETMA